MFSRNFLALLLIAATWFALSAQAEHTCVWKIVGPRGGVLYLGGSIHALRNADYPLPASYNRAFDASDRLIFEVDPGAFKGFDERRDKSGHYPRGDNLKNHVDPRTYDYLRHLFARLNVPEAKFSSFHPWYLALMLRLPGGSGMLNSLGVESFLERRAIANHKPTSGLESAREHLEVFSGLSDRQGEAILLVDLISAQDSSHVPEVLAAWRRGDADAITREAKKNYADFPAFGERIIDARNRSWMPKIERDLASGHVYFVVAGAAHMGGQNGVVAMLKARGYQVEQM